MDRFDPKNWLCDACCSEYPNTTWKPTPSGAYYRCPACLNRNMKYETAKEESAKPDYRIHTETLGLIRAERLRQIEKFPDEQAGVANPLWLAILGEEFGEVSTETINSIMGRDHQAALVAELTQVAAVCVSWIEDLMGVAKNYG